MRFSFWRRRTSTPPWWDALDKKQQQFMRRLADWLGRQTSRMPRRRVRLWLISCIVSLAMLNIISAGYSIWSAGRAKAAGLVSMAPLPSPPMGLPRRPRMRRTLHQYLDSLRRDSVGSLLLDSLFRQRPGLADTLRQVEGMGQ